VGEGGGEAVLVVNHEPVMCIYKCINMHKYMYIHIHIYKYVYMEDEVGGWLWL
jgi:hypothetical protein